MEAVSSTFLLPGSPPEMEWSSLTKTTLVLAVEEQLIRDALASLLDGGGYEIVGACGDGLEALRMVQRLRPQAAVFDLDLPKLHTMEVLAKLQSLYLGVRMLVISGHRDRKTVLEVLRCGASGVVLRSGPAQHLFEALSQILRGGIYITPLLNLEKIFVTAGIGGESDPLSRLSTREYQVFSMLVEGVRPKEIAARLDLSPKTVDTYRASLMKKLNIHDVPGLVKFAMRRSLTSSA
ncbi:MAG: response regulator transcription factor [Acidimicrobiia bacterium]|nr:response regulator transcription factor [Acidimicrobiia bacterium]